MSLVNPIHDQKSKLFGALTSTLTIDDKNKIWEEISGRLSELHGNVRTRDDVMKTWYNILTKHKPRIADKLASARKTGGPADADLDEIEAKISSMKGKEAFEGIESGIDLSLESQCANEETERMLISPVPSEDIEQIKFFQPAPRKRHRLENDELESTKRAILEKEDKKLEILTNIDSKLDRLEKQWTVRLTCFQYVCFSDSDVAKNFHSARTKTEAIITGVLAPMSIEEVLSELQTGIAFSLSTDASNHAELKTFPIIIRYFTSSGVQKKLLDFVHLQDEKSKQVAEMLLDVITKYGLNPEKMIAFCADNAPVNFGGINRAEGDNVFTKLKQIKSKLIPVVVVHHI
ncbi:hypothetical protein LOD99_9139 [Oopsacas minuta]|uniref:Myb/SANT-like DNA-binding domain-containing protein n=1 Tax=Oopsacas minuta TaxID=111878 RepID=A0AAV7JDS4_9METZ|nr:hypothetical protein LOD99_9139 [Oopsacas minuta]